METKLIALYCTICQCNDSRFREELQRQSNNNYPQFTDEELITVYLWGKGQQLLTRKAIYNYTKSHLWAWFPALPSYQSFCRRLNRIAGAFRALSELWMEMILAQNQDTHCYAVDSCPIMLARRSNSTGAKVGKPLCNKCYNATRKEWYHGVKLHAFVMLRPGRLRLQIIGGFNCLHPERRNPWIRCVQAIALTLPLLPADSLLNPFSIGSRVNLPFNLLLLSVPWPVCSFSSFLLWLLAYFYCFSTID